MFVYARAWERDVLLCVKKPHGVVSVGELVRLITEKIGKIVHAPDFSVSTPVASN